MPIYVFIKKGQKKVVGDLKKNFTILSYSKIIYFSKKV